jgi:hypothetical protein
MEWHITHKIMFINKIHKNKILDFLGFYFFTKKYYFIKLIMDLSLNISFPYS